MTGRRLGRVVAVALVAGMAVIVPLGAARGDVKPYQALFVPLVAVYLAVGLLITERRPGNRVGLVVFLLGAVLGGYLVADAYVRQPGGAPGAQVVAWALNNMDAPMFVLIGALFLVFPDGALPSPRWRALVIAMAIAAPIAGLAPALAPGRLTLYRQFDNPFGIAGFPGLAIGAPAYVLVVLCVAVSASAMVVRWRRGSALERAQLKWVALAAVLVGITMTIYAVAFGPGLYNDVMDVLIGLAFGFLAIAIGIAVLRYRLYEIDRIISRTIGWALVTGILVAVFVLLVVGLQAVLAPLTTGDTLAVAASTLVAFALFQPLRRRVQRAVDRRFNRARVDAQRAIDAFGAQLRDDVDLTAVRGRLVVAASTAVQPDGASVWIRGRAR